MMDKIIKTGIFGGTFDPIHSGHLILAESACDRFGLDKVLFMPAPDPYHRTDKHVTELTHRINMVKLAISGNPRFEFSDFELNLDGPTYTVNTLTEYNKAYPNEELYLIIGGDSLFSIENWKDPEQIFKLCSIVTSKREGEVRGASGSCLAESHFIDKDNDGINDLLQADSLQSEFMIQVHFLKEKYNARILDAATPNIEISSSSIISRIHEGKSIRYLVPDHVREYIYQSGCYKE